MQINNRREIIAIKLRQLFVTVALIAILTILYTTEWIKTPLLGFERKDIALFFLGLYILYLAYQLALNRNYIFFTDDGAKIIFRYYSIRPFSKGTHSIEIPKKDFHHYALRNPFPYLIPKIILFQKLPGGIGKFPAISLSSLKRKEIRDLKRCLDAYLKQ